MEVNKELVSMFPVNLQRSSSLNPEVLEQERQDVRDLLINYIERRKTMQILELGAGVGRLSGLLAELFSEVLCTDRNEDFITKNKERNHSLSNILYRVVDANQLNTQFATDSQLDMVFSNWLLMYMTDEQVQGLASNVLRILKPKGYLMFRESHLYPDMTGSKADDDLAAYRSLEDYHKMFVDAKYTDPTDKQDYVFEFIVAQTSPASVKFRHNLADVYWIWQKRRAGDTPVRDLQLWSDYCEEMEEDGQDGGGGAGSGDNGSDNTSQQTTDTTADNIVTYPETGFGTPGGLPLLKEVLTRVNIQADGRVVEVGSGSGGAMKYISQDLRAWVTGVECMVNDVEKSIRMFNELGTHREDIVMGDVKSVCLPENNYDVVCAREFIQCAPDKPEYCAQFLKWLKSGGQVIVAGFFIGTDCEEAHDFVKGFGWPPLCTTDSFVKLLEKSGFGQVVMEDFTDQYLKIINDHLASFKGLPESDRKMWDGFVKSFEDQFKRKLMNWSIVTAVKPNTK